MINFPDYILKYAKQCMNKRQQFVQRYSDLYLTEEIKEYLCNNNLSSKCLCLIIRNNLDYIPRCLSCGKPLDDIHHNRQYLLQILRR